MGSRAPSPATSNAIRAFVSLDEIRGAVEEHHGLVTFVLTPEAEEWRKAPAMLEAGVAPERQSSG